VRLVISIYGTWGHRTHHIVTEEYATGRILPPGPGSILGIFSQMGAISLNASWMPPSTSARRWSVWPGPGPGR